MTRLIELVRDNLNELADSRPVPDGLAERSVAAGRRQRRRRTALVGAAAVVAVAAAVLPVVVRDGTVPPQGPTARNVIFAEQPARVPSPDSKHQPEAPWRVLDPRTGRYREVAVGGVSEPTADLRYAMVLPPRDGTDRSRIGRYATTTGEIRWYDVPAPSADRPLISPDGRYAAYWLDRPEHGPPLEVVDLRTGRRTPIDVEPGELPFPSLVGVHTGRYLATHRAYPGDPVGWRLENDRLVVGGVIFDLGGRRIGRLPLPDKALPVSILPGGAGALVRPGGKLGVYALTDRSGAITRQVMPICADPVEQGRAQPPRCDDAAVQLLGWRGPDHILVKQLGYGQDGEWLSAMDAVDLTTGERRPVYRDERVPGAVALVVIPADGLSRSVRQRLAF